MADQNAPSPPGQEEHFFSSIEIPETSSAEHRLPTPNSLAHDSARPDRAVLLSSSHFDNDELDLLSLAGELRGPDLVLFMPPSTLELSVPIHVLSLCLVTRLEPRSFRDS